MKNERDWQWFKQGIQWDVRCNGLNAEGRPAKPAITVFTETKDRTDAARMAVTELAKYGYSNLTVDKMVCFK